MIAQLDGADEVAVCTTGVETELAKSSPCYWGSVGHCPTAHHSEDPTPDLSLPTHQIGSSDSLPVSVPAPPSPFPAPPCLPGSSKFVPPQSPQFLQSSLMFK